jgi:transcriptional regulator with XRE-family HTH domain
LLSIPSATTPGETKIAQYLTHPTPVPRRPPRLITELLALTASWGWSVADLARELGVDESTVLHYRAGRRGLTTRTLARIVVRFGEHRLTRDLVWHYLLIECGEVAETEATLAVPKGLLPAVEQSIRAYADRFAEESVHAGRGLYIVSDTAAPLSAALHFLHAVFAVKKIGVCAIRADRTPTAAVSRMALAQPLLLVERMDFACDAVKDLVRRRADLARPIVLTSMQEPAVATDTYLRRVFVSTMRRVDAGSAAPTTPPSTTPSRPTHGSVPVESE